MTNQEKAIVYDECIAESDFIQRQISKLKSEYMGNMPEDVQRDVDVKQARIEFLVQKLNSLFD